MGIAMKVNGIMINRMEKVYMRGLLPKGSISAHGSRVFSKAKGKPHIRTDHNMKDSFTLICVTERVR